MTRDRDRVFCATVILAAALFSRPAPADDLPQTPTTSPKADVCNAAAWEFLGEAAIRPAGRVKEPKRLHYVKPTYPDLPPGTRGRGVWFGKALIGPGGDVRKVFVLRDLRFDPPFPEFSRAISEAILRWRYAPTLLDGRAVPVCMGVSVTIHWR